MVNEINTTDSHTIWAFIPTTLSDSKLRFWQLVAAFMGVWAQGAGPLPFCHIPLLSERE